MTKNRSVSYTYTADELEQKKYEKFTITLTAEVTREYTDSDLEGKLTKTEIHQMASSIVDHIKAEADSWDADITKAHVDIKETK